MVKEIKEHLDNYLEFDSDKLFKGKADLACIFGGALRDIVAGVPHNINDIDIMGMSKSIEYIKGVLLSEGYEIIDLVKPSIHDSYKNVRCIFMPITLMNDNRKIVQLIRPSHKNTGVNTLTFTTTCYTYYRLLENVDLSSSGLFYDGDKVYESVKNSYIHCKARVFEKNVGALMYNEMRTYDRANKLEKKGWNEIWIDEKPKWVEIDKLSMRNLKIESLKKYNIPFIDTYLKNKNIDRFIPKLKWDEYTTDWMDNMVL